MRVYMYASCEKTSCLMSSEKRRIRLLKARRIATVELSSAKGKVKGKVKRKVKKE